ncbi:MAG: hypothetical protein M3P30_11565 [Chloroflexota bacterium]|nr:hypothetical protein [Chloroflexota bacterium]
MPQPPERQWLPDPPATSRAAVLAVISAVAVGVVFSLWRALAPDKGPPMDAVGWGAVLVVSAFVGVGYAQGVLFESQRRGRLRKGLEQLNDELGEWFFDRTQGEPMAWASISPDAGDEFAKSRNDWYKHETETVNLYNRKYHAPIRAVYGEFRKRGLFQDELELGVAPSNAHGVAEIVHGVGILTARARNDW